MNKQIVFSALIILIGLILGIFLIILLSYIRRTKTTNKIKEMLEKARKEAEVREIKRVYIDTNKEQSGNKQREKRMNKKDDGIEM